MITAPYRHSVPPDRFGFSLGTPPRPQSPRNGLEPAPYTTQGPEHSSLGRLRRSEQRDLPAIQDAVTPAVGAVVSIVAALA